MWRRFCWCLGVAVALWLDHPCALSEGAIQSEWHYDKLDLTLSIAPDRGELRILGDAVVVPTGAPASDLQLHVNGNWYTLKFVSLSAPGATVAINSTDSKHPAWRIAAVHFAQAVPPKT